MTYFTDGKAGRVNSFRMILALVLAFLSFSVQAEAGVAVLYRGNEALGHVPVREGQNGFVVSVVDAGVLLGLDASVAGEELSLSRGNDRLRIILNAVVAWYNNQLISLHSASYFQDGRWWLDVPSSLNLLQYFAGRGSENALRVEDSRADGSPAHSAAQAPPAQVLVAQQPAPQIPVAQVPITQAPIAQEPLPSPIAEPQIEPSVETQVFPTTPDPGIGATDRVIVVTEPVRNAPAPPVAEQPAQSTASAINTILGTPGVSNTPGELRAVRWSVTNERIRAVLDCSDGTNPEPRLVAGRIVIPFASVVDNLQGVPSPYENVRAEIERHSDGTATFSFAAAGVRVERMVLDAPRRLVFDFIFNVPTVVREVSPVPQPQATTAGVPATHAPTDATRRASGRMVVALDPGHGGRDPGAVAHGLREKDINLAIALRMERALQDRGFDVVMTRRTDVALRLRDRTDIANNANADIFVSIHCNALPPGRNAAGFEIYLMDLPTDQDALELARRENREYLEDDAGNVVADRRTELLLQILGDLQQNIKLNESTAAAEVLFRAGNDAGLPMRRVAQAPFYVLRGAAMPAVLLEVGFLTNPAEARLLANPSYQQRVADAMARGITNYLRQQ